MAPAPLLRLAVLLLGLWGYAGAALACSAAMPAGAARVLETRPDAALFDAAVLAEVNRVRCAQGLLALAAAPGLRGAASEHATWMAGARSLSHTSRLPGKARMADRLRASGVPFRAGAENIALQNRYRFGTGMFRARNAAACQFVDATGRPIPAHSYESLARDAVAAWMASPGHRRNILDGRMRLAGTGLAFDARAPHCGQFYIAQMFAG